ncbi:MAG: hypothetical protein PHR77_18630, partial [Kiritimatiellae bacterium]|nr:hypothetical protein [Kiritimatiellia bacterium]
MAEKVYPRLIYLPPVGRPRWLPENPEGWDLLYLSWGHRWFAENPIPIAMHDGWVYMAVLEGTPQLTTKNGSQRIPTGSVMIIHPDCAYGWTDKPLKRCKILTWVWRTAPLHSALQPLPAKYLIFKPDRVTLRHLVTINANCVREVAFPDKIAFLSLQKERFDLDICLARIMGCRQTPNAPYRMKLAIEFLRNN